MSAAEEVIDAPLDRQQMIARWQALCADPGFEDLAAKIELTEWGEILMSPVSKSHGLSAAYFPQSRRVEIHTHSGQARGHFLPDRSRQAVPVSGDPEHA